jgi:hypothetical protein
VEVNGYSKGIIGVLFKKLLLIADALEGVVVYSMADLAYLKMLNVARITEESKIIKKFNSPSSSLQSYFLQVYDIRGQTLIKHNSKSILTLNEKLVKL